MLAALTLPPRKSFRSKGGFGFVFRVVFGFGTSTQKKITHVELLPQLAFSQFL